MAIADEKYVLLTTFRKRGDPVPSPVWIVGLPDGTVGFTTEDGSGKVKRIRSNGRVTLQPCGVRGAVKEGSVVVDGTAEVVVGPEATAVRAAIGRKYWMMTKLFVVGELWRKVRRKPEPPVCAVRITLA
jgi:hypothetical protein